MGRLVQYFGKNGIIWSHKSAFVFLMVLAVAFSSACSRKMPCPDIATASTKGKKQKKAKKAKVKTIDAGTDGGDGSETAMEAPVDEPTEETAEASTEKKPNLTTNKNKYNKNGLLQKKKYKRLRSNPGKKSYRKGNFFSRLFGGGSSKTKSKAKRTKSVEPVDE